MQTLQKAAPVLEEAEVHLGSAAENAAPVREADGGQLVQKQAEGKNSQVAGKTFDFVLPFMYACPSRRV